MERHQVARDHRHRGEDRDKPGPLGRHGQEGLAEQPQEEGERRRLAARAEERGDRQRRALVGVRRPLVERHGGDLEAQPGRDHHQPDQQTGPHRIGLRQAGDAAHAREVRQLPGDRADARAVRINRAVGRAARHAVDQADPVEHQRRRERAQQHVLERTFVGERVEFVEADQDIEREREQLQRQVGGQQLARRPEQHHPQRGEQNQPVELAVILQPVARELNRRQHREQRDAQEEHAEEHREVIDRQHVGEIVVRVPVEHRRQNRQDQQRARRRVAPDLLPHAVAEDQRARHDQRGQRRQHELRDDQLILEVHQRAPRLVVGLVVSLRIVSCLCPG